MLKIVYPTIAALAVLAACAQAPMPVQPAYRVAPPSGPSPILLHPTAAAAHHSAYVVSVQRALATKGYYSGEMDGDCGPATTVAVERYQQDLGVAPQGDCRVGDKEWSALGLAEGSDSPTPAAAKHPHERRLIWSN